MTARVLPPAWGLPAWTAMSTAIRRLSSISIRMTARRSGGCGSIPPACGVFKQQIHGSKRSLRSVEDFTEFEQRTAYFNGDPIHAMKKGLMLLDRVQVSHMAQMQNMLDFPPAPKLTPQGRLDPPGPPRANGVGTGLLWEGAMRHLSPPFYLDHRCTISKSSVLSTKPP